MQKKISKPSVYIWHDSDAERLLKYSRILTTEGVRNDSAFDLMLDMVPNRSPVSVSRDSEDFLCALVPLVPRTLRRNANT